MLLRHCTRGAVLELGETEAVCGARHRCILLSTIPFYTCGSLGGRCADCDLKTRDPCQVCTTLGMLTPEQAKQLREAGLTAYNHNLDTSPEYYSKITSSRKYEASSPAQSLKAIVPRLHLPCSCVGLLLQISLSRMARCKG